MKKAVMFSGQGSQYPLMGIEFLKLKKNEEKIKIANEILNFDVLKALENKNNELNETKYVQPLMVLVSILIFDKFKTITNIDGVLGFSLGEYSALYASEIYSFEDILNIVKIRSELMNEASIKYPGKMAAILNFDLNELEQIVNKVNNNLDKIVTIANYNSRKQLVISGNDEGVEEVINILKDLNVKRIIPLNVSGGFHSKLMYESSEKLYNELLKYNKNKNKYDLYLNTTANKVVVLDLEEELKKQIYSSVLFYQTIEQMIKDGYNTFIEIGPGKVLSNLVKRNYKDVLVYNIENIEDLNNLKEIENGK